VLSLLSITAAVQELPLLMPEMHEHSSVMCLLGQLVIHDQPQIRLHSQIVTQSLPLIVLNF
jgi:hypothetical protein